MRLMKALYGVVGLFLAVAFMACNGTPRREPDLQAMADSLLPRLEVLSGLEVREPIQVALQDRQTMRAYVERQLDEELPPGELEGLQALYSAFGLIPDTLDLRSLLLDLYTEQVVGYYDPDTDALYIVEGASVAELGPVMVHELVHAIQDQHAELDSLIAPERGNDRRTAAQAAIEGHATLVMFAWLLENQAGGTFDARRMPDLRQQLGPLLEAQNEAFPVFGSAPRIIQETLLFPYIGGATFVQELWRSAPAGSVDYPAPFGEWLPQSTEQVLHPRERFFGARDEPTEVIMATSEGGWDVVYASTLGELETSILLEVHLGEHARSLAIGWDGDYAVLLRSPEGEEALVWGSVWDDAAAADAFAEAYREVLERRPERHGIVERREIEGRPVVNVIETPTTVAPETVPALTLSMSLAR